MKQRYKIKLAVDYLRQNKLKNTMLCILIILCFLLTGIAVMYAGEVKYCETSAQSVLKYGISGTGIITVDIENGGDNDKMMSFLDDLKNDENIYAAGNWSYGATASGWAEELEKIQGQHKYSLDNNSYGNNGMLELIGINPQALDLFQFKIAEGTSPDQLKMEEKNEYMLYLGSAYKGIEVGKYYENQVGEKTIRYKVAGILEKNQPVLIPHLELLTENARTSVYPSEYAVILVSDDGLYDNTILFSYNKKHFEDVKKTISQLKQKYDFQCDITKVSEIFRNINEANQERIHVIGKIAVIIMLITVVLINGQHIARYMDRRKEYGLLYALGAGKRDIMYIMICESIALYIIAWIISAAIIGLFFGYFFLTGDTGEITWYMERDIILKNILPLFSMLALGNIIISVSVVMGMVGRKKPTELLGKDV